ncbi:glycosyltransferase involved in cell wall biosynthesis [Pseudoduganella flava]|uniref:Glycosyltransferase n=1 Tax=Pseudoduganella flava TaxID=871742 RepID=A0A562PTB0_9BURK|nr:glycosyltransferase family 2 protein [Pseudoduganella flava]QGZ39043.1 glycosyltransferase [Pseudoduganella flava]TWI47687.1 glycosyltransferase involved in cell wall biosynthesis [Pseudoduganella flava]
MFKPCAVIPVYNHEGAIGGVTARLLAHGLHCVLVDDGSTAACARVLDDIAAAESGRVTLVRLAVNSGKGAAVMAGLTKARELGYSHALQIDADGQHDTDDVPRFLAQGAARPDAVICGHPVYDESVPKARLYGRYATHIWVWINTLSFDIRDSMCGFRVYPLAAIHALAARTRLGKRMNFDTDVLVRLHWRGVAIVNVPTRVRYPEDGVSHFLVWRDNVLITGMHTALFLGMLPRMPLLLARKWRRR